MTNALDTASVKRLARIGGLLYLYIIVVGAAQEALVRGKIVVVGNPLATADNLRSLRWLWRLGVSGEVTLLVSATILSVILYRLLRPVSRDLALLAVLFNVICIAVEGVAAVSLASALGPIAPAYQAVLTPEQVGTLSLLSIREHTAGFSIALIFFGVECLILGYLIHRSIYMPKAIGILMVVAGVCYIVNSFAWILSPTLSAFLFPAILLPSVVAEASLAIWLVAKGVRAEPWERYRQSDQALQLA